MIPPCMGVLLGGSEIVLALEVMVSLFSRLYRFRCLTFVIATWAISLATPNPAWCESGKRPAPMRQSMSHPGSVSRIYVEPKQAGASPFDPVPRQATRYPLAVQGFSVVDLHDYQRWVVGIENHQALFDGQLYRFADARQRAIFAAAPQRYAPILGGDCLVTFAETGRRVAGDLRYGLQHGQRLFFFAGADQLKQFQESPKRYVDADLAHQGNCVVSKFDQKKVIQGLPKTVVTLGGLRYFFLGIPQQAKFLGNFSRYGAEIVVASESESLQSTQEPIPLSEAPIDQPELQASRLPEVRQEARGKASTKAMEYESSGFGSENVDAQPAIGGYCPVTIRDAGVWEEGNSRFHVILDGKRYFFAGEAEKTLFMKRPWSYIPALAGDCVLTYVETDERVPGSIFYTASYEGRLFMFVGAEERLAFKADPLAFADADLALEGKCAVSYVDKNKTVAGLAEHMTWFQGKRYFFASPELKSAFLADPGKYANPLEAKP